MQGLFDGETPPGEPEEFGKWLEAKLHKLLETPAGDGQIPLPATVSGAGCVVIVGYDDRARFVQMIAEDPRLAGLPMVFGEDFLPPDPTDPMDRLLRKAGQYDSLAFIRVDRFDRFSVEDLCPSLGSGTLIESQIKRGLCKARPDPAEKPWLKYDSQSRKSQLRQLQTLGRKSQR